jgi:hypothetical protein
LIVVVRVRLPPIPVTVTVAAPRAAPLEAVRVSALLVPVAEAGLKLAVTPFGNPLALKATLLLKLARLIVIVLTPVAPRFTVRLAGLAESVKLGALTVRANVVERVSPPPAPLTVTLAVPVAAVPDAARVNVLLPPVVEAGVKLAVTPLGNPVALKATASAKPPVRMMLIALVAFAPWITFVGLAEIVKSG